MDGGLGYGRPGNGEGPDMGEVPVTGPGKTPTPAGGHLLWESLGALPPRSFYVTCVRRVPSTLWVGGLGSLASWLTFRLGL